MSFPTINLSNLRVLIVEDNVHMRQILRRMVSGFGVNLIHEAEDGADALEQISRQDPDIVITDWLMPIVDGAELTRRIRSGKSPGCFVPIIAVTAHTQKRRVIEARDCGVTEILCKPVSAKALYLRVANCVLNQRDFIRCKTFFGPDRRRFQAPNYKGVDRRGRQPDDTYALDDKGEVTQTLPPDEPRESA